MFPSTKTGTRVHADVPRYQKNGMRVNSPKPPMYETALLCPVEKSSKNPFCGPNVCDADLVRARPMISSDGVIAFELLTDICYFLTLFSVVLQWTSGPRP